MIFKLQNSLIEMIVHRGKTPVMFIPKSIKVKNFDQEFHGHCQKKINLFFHKLYM